MLIEGLLKLILGAVIKKSLAPIATSVLSTIEIFSLVSDVADIAECVETKNDCADLGVTGEIVTANITEKALDRVLTVGSSSWYAEKSKHGLYIVNPYVETFQIEPIVLPELKIVLPDMKIKL